MTISNAVKTTMLLVTLSVLLVIAGALIAGPGGILAAFALALIINGGSLWFSDRLVLRLSRAREASDQEYPDLKRQLTQLAIRSRMPSPRVYVIDSPTPNALATGRDPSHASVVVTTGLLKSLDRDEVRAVLAHELAHIASRDTLVATIVASMAGAITMIASVAQWSFVFGTFGGSGDSEEGPGLGGLLGMLLMIVLAPIAATLIQLGISRSREFAADARGARTVGDPLSLARALRKLDVANEKAPMSVNPAIGHQFIVHALPRGGFSALFSTHPSIADRVARLQEMALRPD